MSGLVSFSLFGDDPQDVYYEGAIQNAKLYKQLYPNWDLWFYIGNSVPDRILQEIRSVNPRASFDLIDETEDQTSTWWRYRALKYSDHDFILFRDVDSRPWKRETTAVEEWLESPWPYHTMRDHRFHGRQLLGGLWGVKRKAFAHHHNIPDRITGDWYGVDQVALLTWVWVFCRRQILTHIGCYHIFEKMDQRRPFSVARTEAEPFIAQGLDANDKPRYPGHEKMIDADIELRKRDDIFLEEFRVPRKVSI